MKKIKMFNKSKFIAIAIMLCSSVILYSGTVPVDDGKVSLAEKGKASFPIVIADNASENVKANAATLASYLQKMTGATFLLEKGDGSKGIVFGKQEDFSALPKRFDANPSDNMRKEEYLIYTHPNGLLLTGATDLAAQNAMWDFLGRQGYRQYYPGPTWEIIPSMPMLSVKYDEVQKPKYIMRSVWCSGGAYPEHDELYKDWCSKNRQTSGYSISAGHSYESFITHNKKVFDQHPEYYALVGGVRRGSKLNIANPDLRKLFVENALNTLRAKPEQTSVSVDPSDGDGWDESEEAKVIGSPSNQAVFLANEVATAIEKEFGDRYRVGMYAYNKHGEPPTIKIHPNIVVFVTTAFRGTRLTMKEQMVGWQTQGATLGIRDYFSYPAQNYDIPARCAGYRWQLNPKDLAVKFKNYYDWGARFYSSESGHNWAVNGLFYYSAARLLWDFNDIAFLDGLQSEFISNCFGPVSKEITVFYEKLSPRGNPVLQSDLFHRLYAAIEEARAKKPGETIESRLDFLTLYTRYLELYKIYSDASGDSRIQAAKELFSHLYRARSHMANNAKAVIRDLKKRDNLLASALTAEERGMLRRGIPIWEKRPFYERSEILAMSYEGVKNNPQFDFTPLSYSKDLVPAVPILHGEKDLPEGFLGGQAYHGILYYTWADKPNSEWRIKINCGTDLKGRPIENIRPKISLWAENEAEEVPVSEAEMFIKQGETGEFVVKSPHQGLHWIILTGARFQKIEFDPGKPWTVTSSSDIPYPSLGVALPGSLYFYVPKGTTLIAGYFNGRGTFFNPKGEKMPAPVSNGCFKINVPKGMDGDLWQVNGRVGGLQLLTVPPYLAPSPQDLLLPKEVVEAEKDVKSKVK